MSYLGYESSPFIEAEHPDREMSDMSTILTARDIDFIKRRNWLRKVVCAKKVMSLILF